MNIDEYRSKLIENGFSEATNIPCHFYKELMPYTALGVNIKEEDGGLDEFGKDSEIIKGCFCTRRENKCADSWIRCFERK